MARAAAAGKHKTTKFVFVLVGLLGLFFVVDLLWASSSSPSSNWIASDSINIIVPQPVNSTIKVPTFTFIYSIFSLIFTTCSSLSIFLADINAMILVFRSCDSLRLRELKFDIHDRKSISKTARMLSLEGSYLQLLQI